MSAQMSELMSAIRPTVVVSNPFTQSPSKGAQRNNVDTVLCSRTL
jgi:hypothetical protein